MKMSLSGSDASAHLHGGNALPLFEKYGVSPREVLDFSVSVNPLGPPEAIVEIWPRLIEYLPQYPTVNGDGIRHYYSQAYSISKESILAGNGSVELMYRCFSALPIRRIGVVCPSFFDYAQALRAANVTCDFVSLSHLNGFLAPPVSVLQDVLRRNDGVIIGNPNNPTGTRYDRDTLVALAKEHPSKYIFVDEAFLPFCENESSQTLLSRSTLASNLIIFRSLTKMFAIPGLRAGALVSTEQTVQSFRQLAAPWVNNVVIDHIAPLLLNCTGYISATRQFVRKEMYRLKAGLANLSGVSWFGGNINFALLRLMPPLCLDDVMRQLLGNGLLVRDCRNFHGFDGEFLRFCVRTPSDNSALLSALQQIASAAK